MSALTVSGLGVRYGDTAALVGAGMLSVLVFPALALAIRNHSKNSAPVADSDDVPIEG